MHAFAILLKDAYRLRLDRATTRVRYALRVQRTSCLRKAVAPRGMRLDVMLCLDSFCVINALMFCSSISIRYTRYLAIFLSRKTSPSYCVRQMSSTSLKPRVVRGKSSIHNQPPFHVCMHLWAISLERSKSQGRL